MTTLLPGYILEGLPEEVARGCVAWDSGDPDPAGLPDVEVFVPPYTATATDLAMMARMPNLRVVQTLTAGVENVLAACRTASRSATPPESTTPRTAELAVGLTIASLRHLDDFARAMPEGRWLYDRHEALADKRVLIVGFGSIGRAIARRLDGFECEVRAVARTARMVDGIDARSIEELPGLLPDADVVVLIVPLTPDTRRMVDADFLARMPDSALLVNVSRGAVVDTDALLAECASGRLRAAMDVTDPEPLPADHPLWRTPGVLISPHVGGNTSAFLPRARRLRGPAGALDERRAPGERRGG